MPGQVGRSEEEQDCSWLHDKSEASQGYMRSYLKNKIGVIVSILSLKQTQTHFGPWRSNDGEGRGGQEGRVG